MDETDRKILDILEEDGRASFTEIGEKIDVSEATVRNRVSRMKEKGVIEKFTVDTSLEEISAIVVVKLDTGKDPSTVIEDFPGDLKVFEVTGEHDMVLMVERKSNKGLNQALDDLRKVEGVMETVTKTVLKRRET